MSIVGGAAAKIRGALRGASSAADSDDAGVLNRRNDASELADLPPGYFSRQTALVRERLIAKMEADPSADLKTGLADPDFASLGERVVEYGWTARELLADRAAGRRTRLLDVGCVLNNSAIADVVMSCCSSIWFMNPSPERLVYAERAAYILADPRAHFLDAADKFARVTCFSTLEHVGMNNLRYGGDAGPVTSETTRPEEGAKKTLLALWDLTSPGGKLSVSVPFGPFEYLYLAGDPRPIYYTFDRTRLLNLASAVAQPAERWKIEIWKVTADRGWVPTGIDDNGILPHATGCVGAGAVAIASIEKPD